MSSQAHTNALVFDFGLKHIGVAIALRDHRLARALTTVRARDGEPRWPELDALVNEWCPDSLVVGDPVNMDGSVSPMAIRARAFGRAIADRYGIEVDRVDERLSTFEAVSRGHDAKDAHAAAAETIAETWLATTPPPLTKT